MRSAIFFVFLSVFLVCHGFEWPGKKDIMDHIEEGKKALEKAFKASQSLHSLSEEVQKKLKSRKFKEDMEHVLHTTHESMLLKLNGMTNKFNTERMEKIMPHLMYHHAKIMYQRSKAMHTSALGLAKKVLGDASHEKVNKLAVCLLKFGEGHMRKLTEGLERIMKRHGLKFNVLQMAHMMERAAEGQAQKTALEKIVLEAMTVADKNHVNLNALKTDLRVFEQQILNHAVMQLKALMAAHKVPMSFEKMVAMLKDHAPQLMKELKGLNAAHGHEMEKLRHLAADAFRHAKHGNIHSLSSIQGLVRKMMEEHAQRVGLLLKKHNIDANPLLVRYIVYKHMPKPKETRCFWSSRKGKLIKIGGSVLGGVLLIALISVGIFLLCRRRQRVPRQQEQGVEEKSSIPYAVMADDTASVTKA